MLTITIRLEGAGGNSMPGDPSSFRLARVTLSSTCGQPDFGQTNVPIFTANISFKIKESALSMAHVSMVQTLAEAGMLPSQSQPSSWKQNPAKPKRSSRLPLKPETRALPTALPLTVHVPHQSQPETEAFKPSREPITSNDEQTSNTSNISVENTDYEDQPKNGVDIAKISQPSTSPTPASSATQNDDGIPIPGTRGKKMWPFLPVCSSIWTTKQYEERFEYVVLQLRRVVGSDAVLRMRSQFIDYDLTMAGQTAATACPSICVKCKKSDVRPLRKLFDETAGARLYCYRETRFMELFPNWHASKPPPKPPFKLVYFPSMSNPTNLNASGEDVILHSKYKDTMCGAMIEFRGHHATIGLTLQINEVDWLLTVEHLFREAVDCEPDLFSNASYDTDVVPDSTSSGLDKPPLWANDSDDDSFASEEWSDSDEELGLEHVQSYAESEMDEYIQSSRAGKAVSHGDEHFSGASSLPIPSVDESSPISCTFKLRDIQPEKPLGKLSSSSPFLDWICLRTGWDLDIGKLRQNLVSVAADRPSVLLEKIAEEPNKLETPVYVVSGKLGIRSGTLIGRFSYLGSRFGLDMAKVWTVILDTSKGVIAGECGSIVIDRDTCQVYGHVIGSDVLGHARVAPLVHVVEQIKISVGTTSAASKFRTEPNIALESSRQQLRSPSCKRPSAPEFSPEGDDASL
ncbi:hypothetical protein CkaCkLH20_04014 [Colletotrichum karsti]|uniref:Uncharacterized protein n=1 Tax=Colletotrichum karsti TaxID=1095194 RepID=A0A9P6LNH2_9PEZI|nr:uncharacterized protein CkaCkLH20_04014 [Colletotrichum karsti]KAF9878522.1 hypothetical protein CkaCkLH20_04014 [Colletotrichum karsti]